MSFKHNGVTHPDWCKKYLRQDIIEWEEGDYGLVATISTMDNSWTIMLHVFIEDNGEVKDITGTFTEKQIEEFEETAISKFYDQEERLRHEQYH